MKEFKRGDIFLTKLNDSYLNVQNGIRPCLIIQNNLGNTFSPTLIVVPLTTKIKKKNMLVHVMISPYQMALCECILTISKKQIISYINTIDDKTMKNVNEALSISLDMQGRQDYKECDKAV